MVWNPQQKCTWHKYSGLVQMKHDSFWHNVTGGGSGNAGFLRRFWEGFQIVVEQRHKVMPEFLTHECFSSYFIQSKLLHTLGFKALAMNSLSFPHLFSIFRKLQGFPTSYRYFSSECLNGLCLTRRWNSYGNLLSMHISICNGSISYCRYYK